MKTAIHPTYHQDATITCANCGHKFTVGSTEEAISVEICSQCHPFFTGKKVLIDTEGRADKFMKKADGASGRTKKARKKKTLEERMNLELTAQLEKEKAKEAKESAKKAPKAEPKAEAPAVEEAAPSEEAETTEA